jgi:hypothetical protein
VVNLPLALVVRAMDCKAETRASNGGRPQACSSSRAGENPRDEFDAVRVPVEAAACGVEHGIGFIDEQTAGLGILVEDRCGEYAIAAAEVEEGVEPFASGAKEPEHHVDLLDGERDRTTDVLQEILNQFRILPVGGYWQFGH